MNLAIEEDRWVEMLAGGVLNLVHCGALGYADIAKQGHKAHILSADVACDGI